MRITRRDFMKYCAAAAGALGLSTTDLVKLEKVMASNAADGGTQVVWLNGAACTGCTVTLANTAYFSSIQDLLVPWAAAAADVVAFSAGGITNATPLVGYLTDTAANGPLDLVFMETLSSSVGHRAIAAAESATNAGYVLCIEGSIQTGSSGNYCRIGDGTSAADTAARPFMKEVYDFATNSNCLAVLAVGTCASYGGIPAAKGSATEARGLLSTGRITGGYTAVNTTGYWDYLKGTAKYDTLASISVIKPGSGYTSVPAVTITPGPALATAIMSAGTSGSVIGITITTPGSGYTSAPTVVIDPSPGGVLASATATAHLGFTAGTGLTTDMWNSIMAKTICISGCPPHPDWIVGTIVYFLTYLDAPLMDKWHRPLDFYGQYQCTNCLWQTNKPGRTAANLPIVDILGNDTAANAKGGALTVGSSPRLYKNKYNSAAEGCLGVMGCKGRKTKADCSFRRWNSDGKNHNGIGWCVQTRGGCHGCTDPRYPDGWGKFFAFS